MRRLLVPLEQRFVRGRVVHEADALHTRTLEPGNQRNQRGKTVTTCDEDRKCGDHGSLAGGAARLQPDPTLAGNVPGSQCQTGCRTPEGTDTVKRHPRGGRSWRPPPRCGRQTSAAFAGSFCPSWFVKISR